MGNWSLKINEYCLQGKAPDHLRNSSLKKNQYRKGSQWSTISIFYWFFFLVSLDRIERNPDTQSLEARKYSIAQGGSYSRKDHLLGLGVYGAWFVGFEE